MYNIDKVDQRLSFYVVLYFVVQSLNATIKSVLSLSDLQSSLFSMAFGALLLLVMLRSIKDVIRRNGYLLRNSLLLFAVLYLFSVLASTYRGEPSTALRAILVDSALWTFVWWIPVGVYAASVNDYRVLYKMFLKWSFVISLILIVMVFFHRPSEKEYGFDYSMTFGAGMLIPIMLHLNEFINKKHNLFLLVSVAEIGLLFIYANRSVLLSVVFFILFTVIMNTRGGSKAVFVVLFIILSTILIFFHDSIVNGLIGLFDSLGYRSRSLEMMAGGSFFDSTEREELSSFAKGMILDRPLLGWGLGGEFYHIAMYMYGFPIATSAFSPHNGVLQNLVNFGLFGGAFATLTLVRPFLSINKNKNPDVNVLVLMSGAACLPMFFSASGFFTKPVVALFLYLYYFSTPKNKRIN